MPRYDLQICRRRRSLRGSSYSNPDGSIALEPSHSIGNHGIATTHPYYRQSVRSRRHVDVFGVLIALPRCRIQASRWKRFSCRSFRCVNLDHWVEVLKRQKPLLHRQRNIRVPKRWLEQRCFNRGQDGPHYLLSRRSCLTRAA